MAALNYMVFRCALTKAENRARKTADPQTLASTRHAIERALATYKDRDYSAAEWWANAAERSSLQMS